MSTTPDEPAAPPQAPAATADPRRRRRLLLTITVLTVMVLAVDQLTKLWAQRSLVPGDRTPLLGDLLGLTLVYNPGAALSIATGMTWVLTVVATVVVVVVIRASRRIGSRGWAVALGLLLGGALGNLVDRFAREPGFARGHVVDFLAYGDLFVGNVADVAIVGAAGLIILLALRGIGLDGTREHAAPAHARPAPGREPSDGDEAHEAAAQEPAAQEPAARDAGPHRG
ncbi:signal peptidase II [Cellulomonas fimi]|uniref:Lipoprotein signal peptidase n=1 Tax=Cellulomonas fimi TaxID=1708 RepID=A0A7Y0QHX2_CELFI|nr:signal peptidase II [Cellulomonas fimi]NMR20598.1 signal peptidase II [Cellulomonas fimi]